MPTRSSTNATPRAAPRFTRADAQRLRDHFATEASNAGLRSSHGPLVQMAMSGVAGSGSSRVSAEGSVDDRRFAWRDDDLQIQPGAMEEHRRVYAAIGAMAGRAGFSATMLRAALTATYGPTPRPWHPQVRAALKELGDDIGVAILTKRVQAGLAAGEHGELPEPTSDKKRGKTAERPHNVQVWLPHARDLKEGSKTLAEVLAQAHYLLAAAQEAFAAAYDAHAERSPRRRRRTSAIPSFLGEGKLL